MFVQLDIDDVSGERVEIVLDIRLSDGILK
ncbi:hypothetical protein ES702_03041 [subsurface metagenome]